MNNRKHILMEMIHYELSNANSNNWIHSFIIDWLFKELIDTEKRIRIDNTFHLFNKMAIKIPENEMCFKIDCITP